MKKVLIVDDTKNIRVLLKTCLEVEGFEVDVANDGIIALEMLKAQEYHLIFLDIKMPEISGTEVLRRMRDDGIETPVVIITAFATVKNAVECTKLGAVAYLQKPFTVDKIKALLQDLETNAICWDDQKFHAKIQSLFEENAFGRALDLLLDSLPKKPADSTVYFLISKAYQGLGDTSNSEKFLKASLAFTPPSQ